MFDVTAMPNHCRAASPATSPCRREFTVDATWVRRQRDAHEDRTAWNRTPSRSRNKPGRACTSSRRPRRIVIGSRDIERRAIAWQRVSAGMRPSGCQMTWRRSVRGGKSSPASPIASGLHSFAASAPVFGQPERRDGSGNRGRRGADVESGVRRDGRPRDDVPPSEPFCPDDGALLRGGYGRQADTDCHGYSGQVLLQYGLPHELPRALDGRRILRRRRRVVDRRHRL